MFNYIYYKFILFLVSVKSNTLSLVVDLGQLSRFWLACLSCWLGPICLIHWSKLACVDSQLGLAHLGCQLRSKWVSLYLGSTCIGSSRPSIRASLS